MSGSAVLQLHVACPLLSARARLELAPAVAVATATADLPPVELLALEEVADHDGITVDATFIARDRSGLSTKHRVLPELAACHRVPRRWPQLAWVHTHSAGADWRRGEPLANRAA